MLCIAALLTPFFGGGGGVWTLPPVVVAFPGGFHVMGRGQRGGMEGWAVALSSQRACTSPLPFLLSSEVSQGPALRPSRADS